MECKRVDSEGRKYRYMTRYLSIPGQIDRLNNIENNDLYIITKKEVITFPKLGLVNILIEYMDYSDDDLGELFNEDLEGNQLPEED